MVGVRGISAAKGTDSRASCFVMSAAFQFDEITKVTLPFRQNVHLKQEDQSHVIPTRSSMLNFVTVFSLLAIVPNTWWPNAMGSLEGVTSLITYYVFLIYRAADGPSFWRSFLQRRHGK